MYYGLSTWHTTLSGDNTSLVQEFMDKYPKRFGLNHPVHKNMKVTPLVQCMSEQNLTMMEYLLRQGADINKQGHEGNTPLHIAMFYGIGGADIVKILIRAGADVSIKNEAGYTALDSTEFRVVPTRLVNTIHAGHVDHNIQTHKDEVKRLLVFEAITMGHHGRIGENSRISWLDAGVVQIILQSIGDPWLRG